jgi:23S rRNA (uracil1939-C5)-methyltransferase
MSAVLIQSLDHEGRGIARVEGKTVFVDGALPGERAEISIYKRRPSFDQAQVANIVGPSPWRVDARCRHFGVCGGCSMQHLEPGAQAAVKQRVLEDALWHVGRVRADTLLPAIHGPAWGYRHRARLTVRLVRKKGGVLVGFHERRSSYVADMTSCEVLPPAVAALLPPLRALVGGLSLAERLPQIEVAVGEDVTALVLRILQPLSGADEAALRAFAQRHGVQIWLQPAGPDSATAFHPLDVPPLSYRLPEFGVELRFRPVDFTQVNHPVNRILVRRAMALLAPASGERVADMFCGLGNFTLPIARCGAQVLGVEGSAALVQRAQENAALNGLCARASFAAANLLEIDEARMAALGRFDRMLVDPPREGAIALVKALAADAPRRIVYVSCSPATLARDAAVLVHEKGYRLVAAGIANMFPHTSHVESIACFER